MYWRLDKFGVSWRWLCFGRYISVVDKLRFGSVTQFYWVQFHWLIIPMWQCLETVQMARLFLTLVFIIDWDLLLSSFKKVLNSFDDFTACRSTSGIIFEVCFWCFYLSLVLLLSKFEWESSDAYLLVIDWEKWQKGEKCLIPQRFRFFTFSQQLSCIHRERQSVKHMCTCVGFKNELTAQKVTLSNRPVWTIYPPTRVEMWCTGNPQCLLV